MNEKPTDPRSYESLIGRAMEIISDKKNRSILKKHGDPNRNFYDDLRLAAPQTQLRVVSTIISAFHGYDVTRPKTIPAALSGVISARPNPFSLKFWRSEDLAVRCIQELQKERSARRKENRQDGRIVDPKDLSSVIRSLKYLCRKKINEEDYAKILTEQTILANTKAAEQ